jgi:hypothetical protein
MSRTKSRKWKKNLRTVPDTTNPEIKTTKQHSLGNPDFTDYRQLALDRFNSDNELSNGFGHLENKKWNQNLPIWKWFVESPKSVILDWAEAFQPDSLKNTSIHEASHAVIACLTYIEITNITAVPNPENHKRGSVEYIVPDIYSGKYFGNRDFWLWREVVMGLAGAASENKYLQKINKGCFEDINNAIQLVKNAIPDNEQHKFIMNCYSGIDLIINQPVVWNTIKEIANILYHYGTVKPQKINQIVEDRIYLSASCPTFVSVFNDMNKKSRIAHDYQESNDDDIYQKILSLHWDTVVDFESQLGHLFPVGRSRFCQEFLMRLIYVFLPTNLVRVK